MLTHPFHHALHPNRWLLVVLIIFHLLRPFKVLGFGLVFSTMIGRYKLLLRRLMLRCLVRWCMRRRSLILRSLMPWYLMIKSPIPWSMMLGQRSCAIIYLSGHFLLDLCFMCFEKGALGSDMPTLTTVMACRRSSHGGGLLSAWNISIKLVLPFIFNSGGSF
jgi:hypothetical protein